MRLAQILFSFRGLAGTWRSNWDISLNLNERNIKFRIFRIFGYRRFNIYFGALDVLR